MNLPEFQSWTPWANRYAIENCQRPGVYLLGRFDTSPPGIVDPLSNCIVYIGETCSQGLENRWYQFARSAFQRKAGHSGGWTFSARFCNDCVAEAPPWLHVATLPVFLDEPHQSSYIRFVERWLIWEYVQRHGVLPICNSK
jgi:hypothetical protein